MESITLHALLGFPLGVFWANAMEWTVHRFVLHGLGKNRRSFWSFHWHEHHRLSRRNAMHDPSYRSPLREWNGQTKEALALTGAGLAHLPLFLFVPGFAAGLVYGAFNYYFKHRRAHLDPDWARRRLPWHVDHHLGPDQDANWCVTRPWFDWILGTRVPYLGTERESQDRLRAAGRGS